MINDELRIRLAARPIDDAANDELVRLLSDVSQLRRSAIRIVRGRTSRSKVVQLVGRDVPPDELRG